MSSKESSFELREIDEIKQYLNMTEEVLWKKINRYMLALSKSEVLNDLDLWILYGFRKPKHPDLATGNENNPTLRLYLRAAQATLCDKRALRENMSAPDFPTDPVQGVFVLRDYIDHSYSIFFQRRVSSTLLAVLIIRLGVEKFCGCSQETNPSAP